MTNSSIKNSLFGIASIAFGVALSLGAFVSVVQASDMYDWGGGGDAGYTEYGYSDAGYTEYGYSDAGYTDWGYNDAGYTEYGYNDAGYSEYDYNDAGYSEYDYNDTGYSEYAYNDQFEQYVEQYYEQSYQNPVFNQPSFYPPSYIPPRTTPPVVYPQPPVRPQPQPPVYIPQQPNVTNTNINTNTCTNNSCNTNVNNIDNSINGSFNTATVVTATPQPIIQYQIPQYPVPPVQNQGLYCLISASQNTIQNGQTTYLAWSSSYGATSATLSEAGNVPTTGTYAVRPLTTRMYTLTVYGQNGQTASCNVMVNVNNAAPYVSLSQIPYTGIDFDIMGSAVYWATLLSLAIAGAYLVVYYKGGALSFSGLAFAGEMNRSNNYNSEPVILNETIVSQDKQVAEEVTVEEPKVSAFADLPVMTDRSTKDTMAIAHTGGVPRIVIARA